MRLSRQVWTTVVQAGEKSVRQVAKVHHEMFRILPEFMAFYNPQLFGLIDGLFSMTFYVSVMAKIVN